MKDALKACGIKEPVLSAFISLHGLDKMDDLLLLTYDDLKDMCETYNSTVDKTKPMDKIGLLAQKKFQALAFYYQHLDFVGNVFDVNLWKGDLIKQTMSDMNDTVEKKDKTTEPTEFPSCDEKKLDDDYEEIDSQLTNTLSQMRSRQGCTITMDYLARRDNEVPTTPREVLLLTS